MQIVCPHCDAVNRLPDDRDPRAGKCGRCRKALFDGRPVALTAARFDKHVRASTIPVIADFWAAWCGPCRMMGPIFERAASQLEPKARFVKIDVDAEQSLAARYNVQGIPALFVFRHGKVVHSHSGVADEALLRRWTSD